jgi:hypothetical protein
MRQLSLPRLPQPDVLGLLSESPNHLQKASCDPAVNPRQLPMSSPYGPLARRVKKRHSQSRSHCEHELQ